MIEVCVVDDCNRMNVIGRGLCSRCYHRNKRHGTLSNYPKLRGPSTRTCTVDGCDRTTVKLELCDMHYLRRYRYGTTDEPIPAKGAEHPSWIGDRVSYDGAHDRCRAARGNPGEYRCVDNCGNRAEEWSYQGGSPRELMGTLIRKGEERMFAYSPDPSDYDPRCIRCHRRYDEVALKRWAAV